MDQLGPHRGSPALAYLQSRILHGVKFGLETVRALLAALDHPERSFPSLLVAGTNGKGSVVAYTDALLRADGRSVGRYTSPHLVRINERIAVDGRDLSDDGLEGCVTTVRQAADALVRRGAIADHPTYFEALTVAALHHFRERRVDVAVLEVGMGARWDATNACEPLVSAIVTVARDHEAFLGQTLPEIAREKAGVLRPGRTTVLGRLDREAETAVRAEAGRIGARVVSAHEHVLVKDEDGGTIAIQTPAAVYAALSALPGTHQRDNLIVALRTLEEARAAGLRVDLAQAPEALAAVRWPGRLETLAGAPPVLLDGAHNPAAAAALGDFLSSARRPFVLVFGAMRDKDIGAMASLLFPLAREIVLTAPATPRAAAPEEIVARVQPLGASAHQASSARAALDLARRLAQHGDMVVVAGSLYLVGEVRDLCLASPPPP